MRCTRRLGLSANHTVPFRGGAIIPEGDTGGLYSGGKLHVWNLFVFLSNFPMAPCSNIANQTFSWLSSPRKGALNIKCGFTSGIRYSVTSAVRGSNFPI